MSGSFTVQNTVSFIPGRLPEHPGPLSRFLPPVPEGPAAAWLLENLQPGAWILDPFGAAPRLATEAARAGYRVLVAAHNPIERFLLELACNPPSEEELRATLADLGAAQKAGERIEPHLLALYRSECAQCKAPVNVETFIWEKQSPTPSARIYHCKQCNHSGEHPTTPADRQRAARFTPTGIHRLRALERVTPLDDPDRALAEEALDAYLPRAVYALTTLINKMESFPANRKRLVAALLLPVLDQANTLWQHPIARARPRQLSTPARFREPNIWLALEAAVDYWASSTRDLPSVPLTVWPEHPPASGGISLFQGPLRDLVEKLAPEDSREIAFSGALGAIPRPNQAYWSLSALWAGWLWGHEGAAHFKSVLRRRRYDWAWHSAALHATCKNLGQILPKDAPFLAYIGETEPGYVAAALVAAEMAGFDLTGIAQRSTLGQAQILWNNATHTPAVFAEDKACNSAQQSLKTYLQVIRQPADYADLQAAALGGMVQAHTLVTSQLLSPAEVMGQTTQIIQKTLNERSVFTRIGADKSSESGQWQLRSLPESILNAPAPGLSLADQIEMAVIRYLISHPGCTFEEIDRVLCIDFPGYLTPDQELIHCCLESYAEPVQPESQRWILRAQDEPGARRAELQGLHTVLLDLGRRLGYQASQVSQPIADGQPVRTPIYWINPQTNTQYIFYVLASAMIDTVIFHAGLAAPINLPIHPDASSNNAPRRIIVVPGGRSGLITYKLHHNLFLNQTVEANWQIIKFRHVRRLAESAILNPENLDTQLTLDPLTNQDLQMTML